jgi:hypothetical protein
MSLERYSIVDLFASVYGDIPFKLGDYRPFGHNWKKEEVEEAYIRIRDKLIKFESHDNAKRVIRKDARSFCPECFQRIGVSYQEVFCDECGQRLDWSYDDITEAESTK